MEELLSSLSWVPVGKAQSVAMIATCFSITVSSPAVSAGLCDGSPRPLPLVSHWTSSRYEHENSTTPPSAGTDASRRSHTSMLTGTARSKAKESRRSLVAAIPCRENRRPGVPSDHDTWLGTKEL